MKLLNRYINYLGKVAEGEIEKQVSNFLPHRERITYLDVGCGDGSKTIKRAACIGTATILGIEIEKAKVKEAKTRKVKIYEADLNKKWPFADNSVDCITATEVIEHLVDLDLFLSEVKRVLKPRGKIIISSENLAAYHNILALILGNQPYTGPYLSKIYPIGNRDSAQYYNRNSKNVGNPHLNVMTIKALKKLLQKNNFRVIAVQGVSYYPLPPLLSHIMSRLDVYHASYGIILAEN